MARELVGLKVKIGLKPNGHAKYPNFNVLGTVSSSTMDWSRYIDVFGLGWHYDKTSGHKEETVDSPHGQQYGVLIVPEAFADEAELEFSDTCEIIEDAELETFYEEKAHAHEPDEDIDEHILAAIKAKQDVGVALTPQQIKALDPEDDTPGIKKNKNKIFADFIVKRGVTIKKNAKKV